MTETTTAMPSPRSRWARAGIIFGVWTIFGLVASAQHHISYTLAWGMDLPWSTSLVLQMPVAYVWALATPGIQWLGRRFPFRRDRWRLSVAVHLTTCIVFVFVLALSYIVHTDALLPPTNAGSVLGRSLRLFVGWLLTDGVLYWTVLSVTYAVDHRRRLRERELRASQLETQLAQAELQALKMQLHPHFLFNALHTIGALVRTGDRDNAVRVVASLGDLLRRVVDGAAQHEVPLEVELGLVRSYLAIEGVRFSDRLSIEMDVDPAVTDALVPHLILQPLVENAIRHGIEPHPGAGRIRISATRADGRLRLEVQDDGPPAPPDRAPSARPGIGLSNTRARLTRLYGRDYELIVGPGAGGGHRAAVSLPLRLASDHPEGEW